MRVSAFSLVCARVRGCVCFAFHICLIRSSVCLSVCLSVHFVLSCFVLFCFALFVSMFVCTGNSKCEMHLIPLKISRIKTSVLVAFPQHERCDQRHAVYSGVQGPFKGVLCAPELLPLQCMCLSVCPSLSIVVCRCSPSLKNALWEWI